LCCLIDREEESDSDDSDTEVEIEESKESNADKEQVQDKDHPVADTASDIFLAKLVRVSDTFSLSMLFGV